LHGALDLDAGAHAEDGVFGAVGGCPDDLVAAGAFDAVGFAGVRGGEGQGAEEEGGERTHGAEIIK
jgi:hypothetical protein